MSDFTFSEHPNPEVPETATPPPEAAVADLAAAEPPEASQAVGEQAFADEFVSLPSAKNTTEDSETAGTPSAQLHIALPPAMLSLSATDVPAETRSRQSPVVADPSDPGGETPSTDKTPALPVTPSETTSPPAVQEGGSGAPPNNNDLPPTGGEGEEPSEGGEGDEGEQSGESIDVARVRELTRQYADTAIEKLRTSEDIDYVEVIQDLACALAHTEGFETAHTFAQEKTEEFFLSYGDQATVWTSLYEEGDAQALPEAKRTVVMAGEYPVHDESVMKEQNTAERMVLLVEAGDMDSAEQARMLVMQGTEMPFQVRCRLIVDLYEAGDDKAFDAARTLNEEAQRAINERHNQGEPVDVQGYYSDSQGALSHIAVAAAARDNFEHAVVAMEDLMLATERARVCIALYKTGREEFLEEAVEYMEDVGSDAMGYKPLERELAALGYEPARNSIENRIMSERSHPYEELEDLVALHKSGDPNAADAVEAMVRAQRISEIPDLTPYLERVDRGDVALSLLKQGRDILVDEEALEADLNILRLRPDVEYWQRVVNEYLAAGSEGLEFAATLIREMAERIKTDE